MGLQKRAGKWHWRKLIQGKSRSGSTGLAATERNRPSALLKMQQSVQAILEGREADLKIQVRLFSEAADEFLSWAELEHKNKPRTAKRLKGSMASLKVFIKGKAIPQVNEGVIEDYKTWRRGDGVKEPTLRNDLICLSKFFKFAINHNYARRNPVKNVKLPSIAHASRYHRITEAEERLYFSRAGGALRDVTKLMLLQGCRPEELTLLKQADVDLEKRVMFIRVGKTPNAKRAIDLKLESLHIIAARTQEKSEWVFPSKRYPGRPIGRLNGLHDDLREDLGVKFVMYDFRHTFATRFMERGGDVVHLKDILGHSKLETVLRYVHLSRASLREAILRDERVANAGRIEVVQ